MDKHWWSPQPGGFGLAVGLFFFLVNAHASGAGVFVPMLFALRRLRVRATPEEVVLAGIDGSAGIIGGIVLSLLTCVACLWGLMFAIAFGVASIVLWFTSFRITVTVTRASVRIVRSLLFVPWYVKRFETKPQLLVDGWGDWEDPEAVELHVGIEKIDLAFTGQGGSPIGEAVCGEFNDAVAALPFRS